jgi:biotin carboxyl carrier protein
VAATTYLVTIGERVVRVMVRRQVSNGVMVRIDDGPEQPVDLGQVQGPLRSLVLGDRRVELLADRSEDQVTLAIDGLEYQAQVVDEVRARLASVSAARAGAHARVELKAPMPGLLVRVLCEVGSAVVPGQPLLVLQAMKMENELSLPRGGTVTAIAAQAGQTVEQGQVLLTAE